MTLVSEFRLMSLSVLYVLMYPVSFLTNVLSILDTFNTGVTHILSADRVGKKTKGWVKN